HYARLFAAPEVSVLSVPVWQAALNSLLYAALATAIALPLGLAVATVVARSRRSGWIDAAAMSPLGVSAVIVGLGLLLVSGTTAARALGFSYSWVVVSAAQAVVALPLVVRTLVPSLRAIDVRLRAAAATLGASPWRTWRTVDLPL